ncbi:hypothetical protein BJX64DRAFT_286895 [Aspergillus heterothallicus]
MSLTNYIYMDHYLFPIFSPSHPQQPRQSNNSNSANNTITASNVGNASTNEMASPAPVYLSGLSHLNDTFDHLETSCTNDPPPHYSRHGEDLEMGFLPTYDQAVTGTKKNKTFKSRRCEGSWRIFRVTLAFFVLFLIIAGCIFAASYKG